MLKHLLFLSFATVLLASCKKDRVPVPNPNYYITAKINGVPTGFSTVVGAARGGDRSPNAITVSGKGGDFSQAFPTFTLMLNDHVSLAVKTYTSGTDPVNAGYAFIDMPAYNGDPGFVVTISSITATEIKGSFSGKLRNPAGDIIDVSEGLFSAKIQ